MLASLLTLSDVMCTGHHAALYAEVQQGDTVAVVGDGAVGLCGVLAAHRLGAERIIALSRHPSRQEVAKTFGATDIVASRGDDAIAAVLDLTGGAGVDATLECVGTDESMRTAFRVTRPGSVIGAVGVPHDVNIPMRTVFSHNVGLRGGVAPARNYIPELLPDVLDGHINPGLVFDLWTDLDQITEAYLAMHERRAIKSLVHIAGPS
jgi:threonine dehydrogenase-like Zn-dependent dehydrogenase